MVAETGWPAVTYEEVAWSLALEPGTASRAQLRRHRGPYQAAVLPVIADADLRLAPGVLAAAEDAAAEIARFDSEMGGEIAPFASVLLRSESAASSQIEQLTASARAVAEAELGTGGRANAVQIVANVRAMSAALRLADHLDADSILDMHQALMESIEPDQAGRWRDQPVWIGGSSLGPHDAFYVAPQHGRIEPAIADLVAFIARDDLPILPQAALAHAQFESIHPFTDGNGRTGRALLHAMLKAKHLTRAVTVPVSAGLLSDTAAYFAALDRYRAGDPVAVIERTTDAVFAALANGRTLVQQLREIRAGWHEVVEARQGALTWRIADLLLRHPVVNGPLVAQELDVALPNVYRALAPLEAGGVLRVVTDRGRNRIWRAPQILDAVDAFAARAGRRS